MCIETNESQGNIPIGLLNMFKPRRYEVQTPRPLSTEAPLDIGHKLPPDVLEAVHTEGALLAGLAGDVPLAGVRAAEHREHDVVLGGDPEVCRQVGARFAHVGGLKEIFHEKRDLQRTLSSYLI